MKLIKIFVGMYALFFAHMLSAQEEQEETIIHSKELLGEKIEDEDTVVRVWNLKKDSTIRINLVEMRGELTKHMHPDADHSLIVIKGKVKVLVGDKISVLEQGDFISIPKNVPHKYWALTKTALLASMDAPYYDPKKTVRLE